MPQVVTSAKAARDIERCRLFLADRNPRASERATKTIKNHLRQLKITPDIGRPYAEIAGLRELLIPFGAAGYMALYLHDPAADAVYILAFRHQKEVGY